MKKIIAVCGAIALVLVCIIYVLTPAVNLQSPLFWVILFAIIGAAFIPLFLADQFKAVKITGICGGGLLGLILIVAFIGSPVFMSASYADVLGEPVQADISEYTPTLDSVPLMDRDTAELLMNRTMGTLVDEVSQFELGRSYQINYQGRAVRVSPLEYAGIFKYFGNKTDGIPAYIMVDMQTQETNIHYLDEGMKYSPSAYFGEDLKRHVWVNNPTAILGTPVFEVDEEGTPFWVVPKLSARVGLFGGRDVDGVFCVDAVDGAITFYQVGEIPSYIDNVYSAATIIDQYDNYGAYQNGFLNSLFGQKGVVATTEGYNYIPQGDDVYLYTGVTSVAGDESNIGFLYANLRTKEVQYFTCPGAEEYSAMASAEGAVQHLGYTSTFPLLLNVEGEPTYCVALKDAGGLVKMYGLINVAQYQIVVTSDTMAQCLQQYRQALREVGASVSQDEDMATVSGNIADIRSMNIDGTTYFYIQLENQDVYYEVSATVNKRVVLLDVGDTVELLPYGVESGGIQEAELVN